MRPIKTRDDSSRRSGAGARIQRTLAAALCLAAVAAVATPPAMAEVVDRVVLRVNDRIATLVEFEQRLADSANQLRASDLAGSEIERRLQGLGNQVFRDMLNEMLLLSRADQLRIEVTEQDVDRAVAQVRENFGLESEDALAAALAQQGLSLAGFRDQLRDQLLLREVIAVEVRSQIQLEEDDLRRFYRANPELFEVPERRQVRELVVLEADDRPEEELLRIAGEIRAGLARGESLEALAAQYSEQGLTSGVIDLGWVEAGELAPELEAAIASLAPGGYSEPVPARGGLHILEVLGYEAAAVRPFAEVAGAIDARERERQLTDKLADYMRELEETAYVRAEPPASAAGFRTVAGEGPGETELERLPLAGEGRSAAPAEPVELEDPAPELTPEEPPLL